MGTKSDLQRDHTLPRKARRASAATLILLTMATASLVSPKPSAAEEGDGMQVVGQFTPSVLPPGTTDLVGFVVRSRILTDSTRRILYVVTGEDGERDWVAAYDLDTFAPLAPGFRPDPSLPFEIQASYVDPQSGYLFLAVGELSQFTTTNLIAVELSKGTLATVGSVAFDPLVFGHAETVVSMSRPAGANYLYLLAAIPLPSSVGSRHAGGTMRVSQVSLAGLEKGEARLSWSQPVPDCSAPTTDIYPPALGYVDATQSLYFVCVRNDEGGTTQATFIPSGVGRLDLSAPPTGSAVPTPGPFHLYPRSGRTSKPNSVFDPESGRLAFVSYSPGMATAYVFDARAQSWVGGITYGNNSPNGIGVDQRAGRFYILSSGSSTGLVAADIRPTPVSQGDTYPEFSGPIVNAAQPGPRQAIAVDELNKRLFLTYSQVGHWVIAQDMVPTWNAPPPEDPDSNTQQIPEEPGKTGRTVGTSAAGYGAILRQVGGLQEIQFNAYAAREPESRGVMGGTRELSAAYLNTLVLATGEAGAGAIKFNRDEATTGKNQGDSGTDWPFKEARCVDFQGAEPLEGQEDGVHVKCDLASLRTEASGLAPLIGAELVSVGSSAFQAVGTIDEERGSVAQMVSSAQGISALGGLLTVGEVRVSAEAFAHGRTGTAGSKYERAVSDVSLAGTLLCGDNCDVREVARTVNQDLAGRLRIEFPDPDPKFAEGSPGGYQALIRQGVEKHAEAQALNQQAAHRTEVPGMIVTIYEDKDVTSRTVAYVAGVGVEARYGIFELPQFPSFDPPERPAAPSGGSKGALAPAVKGLSIASPDRQTGGEVVTIIEPAPQGAPSLRPDRPGSPFQEALDRVLDAWRFLMNGPGRVVLLAAMWALLGTPVYLSARRWLLLNRGEIDLAEVA